MKGLRRISFVLAALCLFVVLLLTSFEVAVYGNREYTFYQKEYEKYEVQNSLDMRMEDIMYVTEEMMAYLLGEREELSVFVEVDGERQDFFNEQDRFHMREVQGLFLGGLKLRNVLTILTLIFLGAGLALKPKKGEVSRIMLVTLLGTVGAVAILGVFCAVNFNAVFVAFHHLFFNNNQWLFDPETDYMIRMLPEGFFFDMVVRIGTILLIALILVTAGLLAQIWYVKTKNKQNL